MKEHVVLWQRIGLHQAVASYVQHILLLFHKGKSVFQTQELLLQMSTMSTAFLVLPKQWRVYRTLPRQVCQATIF